MEMKENVVILSASQYQFTDEKTKKELKGCTIHYALTGDMTPIEDKEKSLKGYKPVKASLSYEAYYKMNEVPAVYELSLELRAGSDGKIAVVPTDVKYLFGLGSIEI